MATPNTEERPLDTIASTRASRIAECRRSFAEHLIYKKVDHHEALVYRFCKTNTSFYSMVITFTFGAIIVHGDCGEAIIRPNDWFPAALLGWLKSAVRSPEYLLEKIHTMHDKKGKFYPDEARHRICEALALTCQYESEDNDDVTTVCGKTVDHPCHLDLGDKPTRDRHRFESESEGSTSFTAEQAFEIDENWNGESAESLANAVGEATEGDFEVMSQFYSYDPQYFFIAEALKIFVEQLEVQPGALPVQH